MEIQKEQILLCKKHNLNEVLFVKVDEVNEDESLQYCDLCLLTEQNITLSKLVSIKQIRTSSEDTIIYNYPSLDANNKIINKIMEIQKKDDFSQVIEEVNDFFESLKIEIITALDEAQKKILNNTTKFLDLRTQILEKYKQASGVAVLKQIFDINNSNDMDAIEQSCRTLFESLKQQKQQNLDVFQSMIASSDQLDQLISLKKPSQIKEKIMKTLNNFKYLQEKAIEVNKKKDLLAHLQFNQTNYELMDQLPIKQVKNEYDQITFSSLGFRWANLCSTQLLERNKTYSFKFQSSEQEYSNKSYFVFGLVRDTSKNTNYCTKDFLSCSFVYQDSWFSVSKYVRGIDQITKGHFKNLPMETIIEFIVSINKGVLQVQDYPAKNHVAVLKLEYQENLQNYQDLRFFVGFENIISITLLEAKEIADDDLE